MVKNQNKCYRHQRSYSTMERCNSRKGKERSHLIICATPLQLYSSSGRSKGKSVGVCKDVCWVRLGLAEEKGSLRVIRSVSGKESREGFCYDIGSVPGSSLIAYDHVGYIGGVLIWEGHVCRVILAILMGDLQWPLGGIV